MNEGADARDVLWQEPPEQLCAGGAQQRQVAFHAARDVEHDDHPDRLGPVIELGDRLRLAVVAQLELVLGEIGDELAVAIGDGGEHANGVAAGAKGRLLRAGGICVEIEKQ